MDVTFKCCECDAAVHINVKGKLTEDESFDLSKRVKCEDCFWETETMSEIADFIDKGDA